MDTIINHLFILTIPVLEKIIRPVLVYLFLVIGLRLAGKRELGQLNPFDLIVLLTISNTVQNAIIGEDNTLIGGLIGATTLLVVNFLVVRFIHKNRFLERLVEGNSEFLIKDGIIQQMNLDKESIDMNELETAAQKQGFESIEVIETAKIDPEGNIVFVPKKSLIDEERHNQLLSRLDSLEHEIMLLRQSSVNRQDLNINFGFHPQNQVVFNPCMGLVSFSIIPMTIHGSMAKIPASAGPPKPMMKAEITEVIPVMI